jgi:hypothetical protein
MIGFSVRGTGSRVEERDYDNHRRERLVPAGVAKNDANKKMNDEAKFKILE